MCLFCPPSVLFQADPIHTHSPLTPPSPSLLFPTPLSLLLSPLLPISLPLSPYLPLTPLPLRCTSTPPPPRCGSARSSSRWRPTSPRPWAAATTTRCTCGEGTRRSRRCGRTSGTTPRQRREWTHPRISFHHRSYSVASRHICLFLSRI